MGQMTLDDFRTELQTALGDRGINNPRLDRWINFAYMDIVSAVSFEITEKTATVSGTDSLTVPTNSLVVRAVVDDTAGNLLQWISKVEYYRRDRTATGSPLVWTRIGDTIRVLPVPTAAIDYIIQYQGLPDRLSSPEDVTEIPELWDAAILWLAAHHGFLALGEEQRALVWLQKAGVYIQSRMTEDQLHATSPGLGLTLAGVRINPDGTPVTVNE